MSDRIFLVRHGTTDLNQRGCYCGVNDSVLNRLGRSQMRSVRQRFLEKRFYRVYASDLLRSVQSAQIVVRGNAVGRRSQLREMDFGVFEGLPAAECARRYPELYGAWQRDPASAFVPEAESFDTVVSRVRRVWKEIIENHVPGTDDLVIAHGGPIRIIIADTLGYPLAALRSIGCACGSITVVPVGGREIK